MGKYTFESIEYRQQFQINAFIASIQASSFHWHYEYELILVLEGNITVRMENGSYDMQSGDIILVNSRIIHSIECEAGKNICGIIQMDPGLFLTQKEDNRYFHFYLNSILDDMPPQTGYEHFRRRVARILLSSIQENDLNYYRMRSESYSLVTDLMSDTEYDILMKSNQITHDSKLLMEVIELVRDNLKTPDLQDLIAAKLGYGEKTLYRFFQQHLGMSVKEFIDEMKVEKAKKLLKHTEHSMNFIYDSCGFGSEKTFYRVFHKLTGVTPNGYRKEGTREVDDEEVRGYLDFEPFVAVGILRKILARTEEDHA